MKKGVITTLVIVILVAIGVLIVSDNDTSLYDSSLSATNQTSETQAAPKQETIDQTNPVPAAAEGEYAEYQAAKVANAQDGDVVLFFHADWCPTCRALDQNIEAGNIPEGLTILKVDFDTADDLNKKHGVTYQHTLVQVDSNGEQLKKWGGSYTVDQIVDELI